MAGEEFAPRRSLGTQAIAIAIATGLGQVILGFLYVLAARGSSVEDYGRTIAAIALGLASVGFLDFGTTGLWVREMSAGRLDTGEFSRRATWKIFYILMVTSVWAIVVLILFPTSPYWVSGLVALTASLSLTVQTGLRARGRTELAGVSLLIDRVFSALLFVSMSIAGDSALAALVVGIVGGPALGALVSNRLLLRERRIRVVLRHPVNPWRGSGNFGLATAGFSVQSYGDVPLIAVCAGPVAAGIYGAVSRWTQPVALLAQAYSSAAAPYVSNAPTARAGARHLRSAAWLPLLAILACVVMIIIAPWLVTMLLGEQYADSGAVLRLLAAGTLVHILGLPLYTLLMGRGHDRAGAFMLVISVGTTLVLIVFLASRFGAVGAGVAYLAGQIVLSLGLLTSVMWLAALTRASQSTRGAS